MAWLSELRQGGDWVEFVSPRGTPLCATPSLRSSVGRHLTARLVGVRASVPLRLEPLRRYQTTHASTGVEVAESLAAIARSMVAVGRGRLAPWLFVMDAGTSGDHPHRTFSHRRHPSHMTRPGSECRHPSLHSLHNWRASLPASGTRPRGRGQLWKVVRSVGIPFSASAFPRIMNACALCAAA